MFIVSPESIGTSPTRGNVTNHTKPPSEFLDSLSRRRLTSDIPGKILTQRFATPPHSRCKQSFPFARLQDSERILLQIARESWYHLLLSPHVALHFSRDCRSSETRVVEKDGGEIASTSTELNVCVSNHHSTPD